MFTVVRPRGSLKEPVMVDLSEEILLGNSNPQYRAIYLMSNPNQQKKNSNPQLYSGSKVVTLHFQGG
jgi:hypothetical protein